MKEIMMSREPIKSTWRLSVGPEREFGILFF